MKTALIVVAILAALPVLMALIGSVLPRDHVTIRMAEYHRPPSELYAAARDFSGQASWRTGIRRIELLPPTDGHIQFNEVSGRHAVPYSVVEDRPSERLVLKIADEGLSYGGTWTLEFLPASAGGALRITERGFVKNVIFRFLSRTVFSTATTIETYLKDLGRKYGETVTPRP